MKNGFLIIACSTTLCLFGQRSEELIPNKAVTVFSINNIDLLQKVSVDELINYDFMHEIHQELFDGSTTQKTLKDAGVDFKQKLNIFYGKNKRFEISGFSFGVNNTQQLFDVFDDFQKQESQYEGTQIFSSLFNTLVIKGQSALLFRVEPIPTYLTAWTDSIWYSRGNLSPYYDVSMDSEVVFSDLDEFKDDEDLDSKNSVQKNYNELRDSIQYMLQKEEFETVLNELIRQNKSLMNQDPRFKDQINHVCEGTFYMDNSRNIEKMNNLWYLKTLVPNINDDIQEIYKDNLIVGDLFIKDQNIEFKISAQYGAKLGSIYEEMNDSKFDKSIIKYIHKDHSAYFTYNINLRKAYDKAFEVVMPILAGSKNTDIGLNVLILKLANELINKDALFDTYKGSMFGSFNGIKKIKTKKIVFFYDEVTFEYGEKETEAYEDMPVFTLGFSTKRPDIPEMILEQMSTWTSLVKKEGEFWRYDNAILDAAPLFMINRNGLFLLTNDEDLVYNHIDGFGSEALSKKTAKTLKKGGFMNAKIDIETLAKRFPTDLLDDRQKEMIASLQGKSGVMTLGSSETSNRNTDMTIVYNYPNSNNSGHHLLDLINTVYLLSK